MRGERDKWIEDAHTSMSKFPGFRFCPTDEELISYYLKKKVDGSESSVQVIPEVEIWKYEPWELPANSLLRSHKEWFFFSRRGRKYPNGSQSRRATEKGYWKATGKERSVTGREGDVIGTKRTLVFHLGRAPRGERTEWIMHEYSLLLISDTSMVVCRLRKNTTDFGPDPRSVDQQQEPQSSRNQADNSNDDDDDFFADILNDDIITLDHHQLQGTAYRRINLARNHLLSPPTTSSSSTSTTIIIVLFLLLISLTATLFFFI